MKLEDSGYEVQTIRLATPPPGEMGSPVPADELISLAKQLEAECFVHEIDYASIGPAIPGRPERYEAIPEILAATESIFASGMIADLETGLSLPAAKACASAIQAISSISPDGFANLRFAALANVGSGAAFFPAAYHRGGRPAMAVAPEAVDLAITAFSDSETPQQAARTIVERIEGHASVISRLVQSVTVRDGVRFLGIDFSMAPFPDQSRSIGKALQALGVPRVGLAGTTAAAAFLADCLDRAQFRRTGFCGLMFPVLEDSVLAHQAAQGVLRVHDLLLYSTVCGTGLDTIPLPGDTSPEALYALLLDLGSLALRHDKPLTARLMPIPGKKAGDEIHFDFAYFADSRVMTLDAVPLGGKLDQSGLLDIGPHGPARL
jgi:uncharacterized protein (UPF0210 family)